jgi:hypothetical protein
MIPTPFAVPVVVVLLIGLLATYAHLVVRKSELAQLSHAAMTCAHAALVGYLTWRYAESAIMDDEEERCHRSILVEFSSLQAHFIKGEYGEGVYSLKTFVSNIEGARVIWAEKQELIDKLLPQQEAASEQLLRDVLQKLRS